ncbi:MAG: DUF4184 family protein [Candidatus Thorarchaeota archaeon SMTZ1-45]|nr:MAG: hypothetical protein AM325_00585 [Candidatus Thorarchaeota archaeon SMTZ1-45]
MPITPLHYPLAFALSKTNKKLLLPGVVVGAVIPDIEVPFMWIFFNDLPDHLILHSLVGAVTVGTLLAVVVTWLFYPPIISTIFRVNKDELMEVCTPSAMLFLSCLIGVLSHLLLDYPMHWFNPILWPWVNPYDVVGPLVLFFAPFGPINRTAFWMANRLTSAIMILAWIPILVYYQNNDLWTNHWLGGSRLEPSQ